MAGQQVNNEDGNMVDAPNVEEPNNPEREPDGGEQAGNNEARVTDFLGGEHREVPSQDLVDFVKAIPKYRDVDFNPMITMLSPDKNLAGVSTANRSGINTFVRELLDQTRFHDRVVALMNKVDPVEEAGPIVYGIELAGGGMVIRVDVRTLIKMSTSQVKSEGIIPYGQVNPGIRDRKKLHSDGRPVTGVTYAAVDINLQYNIEGAIRKVVVTLPAVIVTNLGDVPTEKIMAIEEAIRNDLRVQNRIMGVVTYNPAATTKLFSEMVVLMDTNRVKFSSIDFSCQTFRKELEKCNDYETLIVNYAKLYMDLVRALEPLVKVLYLTDGVDGLKKINYEFPYSVSEQDGTMNNSASTSSISRSMAFVMIDDVATAVAQGNYHPSGALPQRVGDLADITEVWQEVESKLSAKVTLHLTNVAELDEILDGPGFDRDAPPQLTTVPEAVAILGRARAMMYRALSFVIGTGPSNLNVSSWLVRALKRCASGTPIKNPRGQNHFIKLFANCPTDAGSLNYLTYPASAEHGMAVLAAVLYSPATVVHSLLGRALTIPAIIEGGLLFRQAGTGGRPLMPAIQCSNGSLVCAWLQIMVGRYLHDRDHSTVITGIPPSRGEAYAGEIVSYAQSASRVNRNIKQALYALAGSNKLKFPNLSADEQEFFKVDPSNEELGNIVRALVYSKPIKEVLVYSIRVVDSHAFRLEYVEDDGADEIGWGEDNCSIQSIVIRTAFKTRDVNEWLDTLYEAEYDTPQEWVDVINGQDLGVEVFGVTLKSAYQDGVRQVFSLREAFPKPRALQVSDLTGVDYADRLVDMLAMYVNNLEYLSKAKRETSEIAITLMTNCMQYKSEFNGADTVWGPANIVNLTNSICLGLAYRISIVDQANLGKTRRPEVTGQRQLKTGGEAAGDA